MPSGKICKIDGCGKHVIGRGWCSTHYQRWLAHGDPLKLVKPRLAMSQKQYLMEVALPYRGDDCLIWPLGSLVGKGYAPICRALCELVHGPAPSPTHHAAHCCGNGHRACINPKHLSWKTPVENAADKKIHGTHRQGSECRLTKLTEDQVVEIVALLGHETHEVIASRYGVSREMITRINCGKAWAWLTGRQRAQTSSAA